MLESFIQLGDSIRPIAKIAGLLLAVGTVVSILLGRLTVSQMAKKRSLFNIIRGLLR